MWCNVYVRVHPRIRKQAVHKQWCQISWFGSKFYSLMIKVSYNRCKDIHKFGNKYLPSAYMTQVDFRSHFLGKKVRPIVPEIRYMFLCHRHQLVWWPVLPLPDVTMECFILSLMYLNKFRKFNLYQNCFQILFLQLLKTHAETMKKVFINKLP